MNKQPEITARTRQKFVDTFWELAEEKPIAKITVYEIAKHAGYNRSTFYEYFPDTDNLLAYIENQLLEEVKQTALQNLAEMPDEGSQGYHILASLVSSVFFTMNEKIYLLAGPNGDPGFMAKVRETLLPIVSPLLPFSKELPNFDYLISFFSSAIFSLLQHWHEQDKNLSPEEVSTLMRNLVLYGISAYIAPTTE